MISPGQSDELHALREENRTLSAVIQLVSSSLELVPMLQGVVELATEATGCHACFIYLLRDGVLTIRAASPVFAAAVDEVSFSVHEGLTGWVARHRTPEFIREQAMRDPRMKYVPLLEEEHFQSMAAVPILSRAGETIGVIVLHTRAPHEFGEDALRLLEHIASLVSGAIENAQLYEQQRRRVDALTGLSELAQRVAAAPGASELGALVVDGLARLLDARVCQLLRLEGPDGEPRLVASVPVGLAAPAVAGADELVAAALPRGGAGGRGLWPSVQTADLLVVPLAAAGERVGLLCLGAPAGRSFAEEDAELARAMAHLAALALERAELIEGLTHANVVRDLFQALAAGATSIAAARAAETRCELSERFAVVVASPLGEDVGAGWGAAAEAVGSRLSELARASAVETGPGPVRALLVLDGFDALMHECRELGRRLEVAIGVSDLRRGAGEAVPAYREARDAATVARALMRGGGAVAYPEVGAYRYLVQIGVDEAPRDRMRAAVDTLIAYDRKRRTALLDTLERYLSERRSVIESARSLYIHPNTLRQRLGRIEELTGLDLDADDLLSLELAIKLARLHGRPSVPTS